MESFSTMPNLNFHFRRFLDHRGGVCAFALVLLLLVTFVPADAQTAVVLAPVPQLQFFDQSGNPLAFGCVFTYQVASTTPLASYTDYSGVTLNANPVILTAGGSANIWLQAGQAYTFRVMSAGGTNCASGNTLYTVDGIGGGSTTLTTIVNYSTTPAFQDAAQNQLFEITLTGNASSQPLTAVGVTPPGIITWEITQDGAGSHTFSWPANTVGGVTISSTANVMTQQSFIWNGVNAIALGPATYNFGSGSTAFGVTNFYDFGLSLSSPVCTNGTLQLSSTCGSVLNVIINGQTIAPGGSGNVNSGAAAHSIALNEGNGSAITGLLLGANQIAVGVASADPVASTIPTCTGGQTLTFSGTLPLTCTNATSVLVQSTTVLVSPVGISANTATTWLTKAVTMPASGCPCRVHASYSAYFTQTSSGADVAWLSDGTTIFDTTQTANTGSTSNYGMSGVAFSPSTYANNAVVTFTASFFTNSSGGGTVMTNTVSTGVSGQQASWLSLAVFTSN
jgi:hypothetical protein